MRRRRFRIAGWLAASVLVVACPALALHRETPPSVRITSGRPHVLPPTRSWGNYLAFPSSEDLLGTGVGGRQIYMWNLADYDCNRGTTKRSTPCAVPPRPDMVRVTEPDRQGNPDNGSANTSGNFVTFDADGVYGGGIGPQAQRRQIFLVDRVRQELLQITQAGGGDSVKPTINRSANMIAFESTAPLLGQHGPPGVRQVFVYFVVSRKLIQLTAGAVDSTAPMPDGRGEQVVFQSAADLLGDGHDTGISQIFVADLDKDNLVSRLNQLTRGDGPSRRPFTTENKPGRVVFESTATDLPGTTPGPGVTIYSAPAGEGNFPSVKQHTGVPYGSCEWPAIDAGGQHITFVCDGDPLQNGTTGKRIFLLDTTALPPAPGALVLPVQLTGRGDVQGPLSHNLGIFFVAFASTADTSKTGACGPQLQVIDYYTGQPGHWRGASAIGELPPDMLPELPPDPTEFPPPASNYLGAHVFDIQPMGSAGGSFLEFTTRDGTLTASAPGGRVGMFITPHAVNGEATVTVPAASVFFPPIAIPGFGVMCIEMEADGEGAIDCDGGRQGGDLLVTQDHDTRDIDVNCQTGCAEDAPCQNGLLGPHRNICPSCASGVISMCNGPIQTARGGTLSPGGMLLFLPIRVRISVEPGVDRRPCTADDAYQFRQLGGALEMTTETVSASIIDGDASSGFTIDSTPLTGFPLDCNALKSRVGTSIQLNGVVPVLDVPTAIGLRDVILGVHIDARSRPLDPRAETSIGDRCRTDICNANAQCSDGNPCNGIESCAHAACLPGASLCDDGDPCNGTETCNPGNATCGLGPIPDCDDGSMCTFDACMPGVGCVHVNPCDDNNACNGIEICDPRTGACSAGVALTCNDGNPCTTDSCNPLAGCVYVNNSNACSDGLQCTSGDTCVNGVCTGTPVVCNDNNVCNGLETCNPSTGACTTGTSLSCDDGNPCTDDSCNPLTGCLHIPNVAPCSDGSACTAGDVCVAGTCVGVPVVVCPDDGDPCNGTETCNPSTGTCGSGTPPSCDDGNPCTDDTCVPLVGCTNLPNVAPCNDGNTCTFADTCQNGTCTGTPVDCSDLNICNGMETCNPSTAACVPGPPPNCDDGDVCTIDSCDPLLGCQHVSNPLPSCALAVAGDVGAMVDQVQKLPPASVGGEAIQQRLMRLLHQAQTRLQAATKGSRGGSRKKLGVVLHRLRTFIAVVEGARSGGKMDADIAGQLIDQAAAAIDRVPLPPKGSA